MQDIIDKLRAAHEMLDGLRADVALTIDGPRGHLPEISSDLRWGHVLKIQAECIDALVKAGEEGR